MKPGKYSPREVDALIWQVIHNQTPDLISCRYVDNDVQPHAGYPAGHISPPKYGEDIEAALQIAEYARAWIGRPRENLLNWFVLSVRPNGWACTMTGHDENTVYAPTAPMAILSAAIVALGWKDRVDWFGS